MTDIVVDCNNDRIIIQNEKGDRVEMAVKFPDQLIKILQEVINMVYDEPNITLERIDEDHRKTIEEW